jgi:hypothetical protein
VYKADGLPVSEQAKQAGIDVISAKQAMADMHSLRQATHTQKDERQAFMVNLRCKDDLEQLGSDSDKTVWQSPVVSQKWHAHLQVRNPYNAQEWLMLGVDLQRPDTVKLITVDEKDATYPFGNDPVSDASKNTLGTGCRSSTGHSGR